MKKTTVSICVYLFFFIFTKVNAQTSNQGLYFDGVDDRVTVNHNGAYQLGAGSFTFETWIRMNTIQTNGAPTLLSKNNSSGLRIYFSTSGKLVITAGGFGFIPGSPQIDLRDSVCHHIAVVRNDSILYAYIDGNLYGTSTGFHTSINSTANITIGSNGSGNCFNGIIHDVRFWNVARTQSQIQAAKNAFLTGNETGLIGYWRMNDGAGQTVNDLSPTNSDGFLGFSTNPDGADAVYQAPNCICSLSAAITPGGPTTFCPGGSVTLTANSGTGFTYQWKLNGSNISGATSQNYIASQSGNYTVEVGNNGCTAVSSITTITVSSAPSATITPNGPTTFCSGGSVTLFASSGSGYSYQWKLNGTNISGATLSNYSASQNGSFTVLITNNSGCTALSAATAVTVNSLPTATITPNGPVTFCSGGNVTLTANSGAGYLYQWYKNSATVSGATLQNYVASQTGNYTVRVTNSSNCYVISTALTLTVNVPPYALTYPNGSTPVSFCSGSGYPVSAYAGGVYSYQWQLNGSNITGATSQIYNVTADGTYRVIAINSCGSDTSNNLYMVSVQPVSPVISNNTTTCNPLLELSVTQYANATFQWYESANQVLLYGQYQPSMNVGHTGYFQCAVTNACGTYWTQPYIANPPTMKCIIESPYGLGNAYFCPGDSILLDNYDPFTVSNWQWIKDGIPVTPTLYFPDGDSYYTNQPGIYSCLMYISGCGFVTSNAIGVYSVASPPSGIISPSGPLTFCSGGNVKLYAISDYSNTYQWKNNGVNISGATNYFYTATSSGNYTVYISNMCGSVTSSATTVTVNSLPSATITPAGPTTFCSGDSVVLNAVVAANRTYQWKKNNVNISGATLSSYTATAAGNYKVTVTNTQTGCSKTTGAVTAVTVNAKPASVITPQGSTTFCVGGSVVLAANTATGLTYKWKKGSTYISGATLANYTATTAGTYRVEVTNSNGCSKLSAGTIVTVPCKEGETALSVPIAIGIDVKVFPNPSSGGFVFEIKNTWEEKISIHVYDIAAKLVLKENTFNSQFTIWNSQLKPGIYSAVIIYQDKEKIIRLVKTK